MKLNTEIGQLDVTPDEFLELLKKSKKTDKVVKVKKVKVVKHRKPKQISTEKFVTDAIAFLKEHPGEKFTLSKLGKELGLGVVGAGHYARIGPSLDMTAGITTEKTDKNRTYYKFQ